ncbi:MAG: hypothetical protein MJZ00_06990 [Paludibacteraceae bacterium]|nr:hypothetical protein [Paludibacteraceae bacterium]
MDKETMLFALKTLKELIAERDKLITTNAGLFMELGIFDEHANELAKAYNYQKTLERYADALEKELTKNN